MYLVISITTKARKIGGQLSETEQMLSHWPSYDAHNIYLYVNALQFSPTFVSVANQAPSHLYEFCSEFNSLGSTCIRTND
jgi:hypothetical protein